MEKYKWNFMSVGGNTRVKIATGEDIRHLGELDQKMWTVLSCPTKGLELDEQTLSLMDTDADGRVRVNEVVATSQWLCSVLKDPQSLIPGKDSIALSEIADEAILAVAKQIAGDKAEVSLADVDAAIAAVTPAAKTAEVKEVPAAPYDAAVIAAVHDDQEPYNQYFTDLRLEKMGLKKTDPEAAPAIKEEDWTELTTKIGAYEAEKAAIEAENAAAQAAVDAENAVALAAATDQYKPLRKLLLLKRDFYTLLANYVTLSDFYSPDKKAIFQAGTLIIDQRACDLCVAVQDAGAMGAQAGLSGMYLLFCDCVNKPTGKSLSIVAAMTAGDVKNLSVGKNAIFYDRNGLDYDAKVTKIIDNPISIRQAFWTPYRKFGNWVKDLINKSAAEKESKGFEDMKANATVAADKAKAEGGAAAVPAFDIAKFAGIFAAIGMALGMISTAILTLFSNFVALTWWQMILVFVAILLIISGPSMFIAWTKLRARNLAPVLNANGWAINAEAIVNVKFGATLCQTAKFPVMKLDDPYADNGLATWKKCLIALFIIIAAAVAIWFAMGKPCCCGDKECETEVVAEEVAAEDAPVEAAEVVAEVAE